MKNGMKAGPRSTTIAAAIQPNAITKNTADSRKIIIVTITMKWRMAMMSKTITGTSSEK